MKKTKPKISIAVGISTAAIIALGVTMTIVNSQTQDQTEHKQNRLAQEKSPYLLQHAENPVDWRPWSEEAFEKARRENKPIFLSIGYSTCHWCHVMEHESFEDEEVAKLMNETFVCIKVDREERPDIDHIYMSVCQAMTGSGGWPLTIVMTPDQKPFFAGTYFPKTGRFGRPGMMELVPKIKELWKTKNDDIIKSADQVAQSLQQSASNTPGEELGETVLNTAQAQLAQRYDSTYGGFNTAPKFPTPHNLNFLLRWYRRSGDQQTLRMVEHTLQSMRRGGMYDHIGFGFHRYATDHKWLVPHFEKMLYDQALMALAYLETYQITKDETYAQTAREIFTYILRDMTSPQGGFYSAEDADSEGEEGKFYVWTEKELRTILSKDEADLVISVLGVTANGNFAEEASGKLIGSNILHRKQSLPKTASDRKLSEKELHAQLETIRNKLFAAREKRTHPYKDDKILTDWNGLMIAALARGAQVLDEPRYAQAAQKAVDFVLENLISEKGRLLHRYRNGDTAIQASVSDYAFFIWSLLELYETNFEVTYLQKALDLNEDLLKHYWDEKSGGFFFTPDDGEKLIVRTKEIYDGAIPSGNAVAMLNLLRLARITGDTKLEEKAAAIGKTFSNDINRYPAAYTQLLCAVDFGVGPAYEVVIAGNPKSQDTQAMLKALRSEFIPNKVVLLRPVAEDKPPITQIAAYTQYQKSQNQKATAYVCLNQNCQAPTNDPAQMLHLLKPPIQTD
jgi:uncharacterized protein